MKERGARSEAKITLGKLTEAVAERLLARELTLLYGAPRPSAAATFQGEHDQRISLSNTTTSPIYRKVTCLWCEEVRKHAIPWISTLSFFVRDPHRPSMTDRRRTTPISKRSYSENDILLLALYLYSAIA